MINVRDVKDVYPAVKQLISELMAIGRFDLAELLDYRMYKVPWTTGNELLEELQNVLTKSLSDKDIPQNLKAQMKQIVSAINTWFKTRMAGTRPKS